MSDLIDHNQSAFILIEVYEKNFALQICHWKKEQYFHDLFINFGFWPLMLHQYPTSGIFLKLRYGILLY